MNMDKAFSLGGAFVVLGGVTVLATHPKSARVIIAVGQAFSGALRTAMGH